MSLVFFEISDVEIKEMAVKMHRVEMILLDPIQNHISDFGYDFAEIAKMLDMNETAIRVALSRARKTMRERLTKTHS